MKKVMDTAEQMLDKVDQGDASARAQANQMPQGVLQLLR